MKKVGNVLELRDVVLPVAAVFHQQREGVVELLARVSRIQFGQLPVDGSPRLGLFLGVTDSRDRLATAISSTFFNTELFAEQ